MPWFKVDDSLESHPKVKAIPRPRRLKAMGLWVLAGSWCASQLTDGFVPNYMISELSATKREATTLVEVGLWSATEGGYVFKDWHDWQPTKAVVEAGREAARERMRVARERKKGGSSEGVRANTSELVQNGSGEVRSTPRSVTPTRPDPTRPNKDSTSEADASDEQRPEVINLCEHLAKRVTENGAKNVKVGKRWHDAARLMLDVDGYTEFQIAWLIDKASDDEFWRSNILSMPKLREKADQLRLKFAGSNVTPIRTDDQGRELLPPLPSRNPWGN